MEPKSCLTCRLFFTCPIPDQIAKLQVMLTTAKCVSHTNKAEKLLETTAEVCSKYECY